jgi:SpoVK/Ycf46/Vps4 family AAA+-type ATPase
VGVLYGSLVGQTEQNVRQALKVAGAMSPCVLYCDEVEKALSGLGSSGDSGLATRLFGTLLTYLSGRTSDVFVVGTCNDIGKLPPEFSRAERWDGLLFLDLPSTAEKEVIWAMYLRPFGLPAGQARPDDANWTGAEIKSCCRPAALLDMPLIQAAHHVAPVAVTAAEQVERLRTWASGRCLSACAPGVYRRDGEQDTRPGRRVQRGPSNN